MEAYSPRQQAKCPHANLKVIRTFKKLVFTEIEAGRVVKITSGIREGSCSVTVRCLNCDKNWHKDSFLSISGLPKFCQDAIRLAGGDTP